MRILSADIGGTRARFQFAEYKDNHLNVLAVKRYASKDYNSILTLIEKFMEAINEPIKSIDVACFAVAGPIVEGQVQLTNLPWGIDEKEVDLIFCLPGEMGEFFFQDSAGDKAIFIHVHSR